MKKLLLVLPVLVIGLFLAVTVLAQEAMLSAEEGLPAGEAGIYTPNLLPDNSFYFLKPWKERIELFVARKPEAKAEKYAEMATRRIAEAKQMIRKNKPEFIEKLMERHREHLEKAEEKIEEAKGKGRDVERLLERVTEATSTHLQVLAEVYEKVPEQAKEAIEQAIEVSNRGQERVLEAISGGKKEELRQQVEEKLEKKKPVIKKVLEKRLEETLPTEKGKAKPAEELEECVCITLYEPVCGIDGRTYTNECWLDCAEVKKAYEGECQNKGEEKGSRKPAKIEN